MAVNISDTLTLLTGKKPTDAEIAEITRVIHGLGAEEYNIFIKTLIFLYYQTRMINDAPNKLKESVENTINQVNKTAIQVADIHIKELVTETQNKLSKAVETAAIKSAKYASGTRLLHWLCIGLILLAGIMGTGWYYAYNTGQENGYERGKADTRNQELWLKKWDNFSKTDEFQSAFQMYEKGDLRKIIKLYNSGDIKRFITCSGKDWTEQDGICWGFSYGEKGEVKGSGWKIP